MSFLKSLDISASAMTAQRVRMDVISENLANASTTRTANGGPYRRRVTVFEQQQGEPFSSYLQDAQNGTAGNGVKVTSIVEDTSPFKLQYDPTNPDADANGYVQMPNVDEVKEMVDMMDSVRSFENSVTAFNTTKSMALKALEIGK